MTLIPECTRAASKYHPYNCLRRIPAKLCGYQVKTRTRGGSIPYLEIHVLPLVLPKNLSIVSYYSCIAGYRYRQPLLTQITYLFVASQSSPYYSSDGPNLASGRGMTSLEFCRALFSGGQFSHSWFRLHFFFFSSFFISNPNWSFS